MILPTIVISFLPTRAGARAAVRTFTASPLYSSKTSTFVLTTQVTALDFKILIKNDVYSEKVIASKVITKAGTYTFTYDNRYTRSKNQLFIRYDEGSGPVNSPLIQRDIVKGRTEYIVDNRDNTSNNTVAVLNKNLVWSTGSVKYSFENFEGLYSPDYYHKIRLADFKVKLGSLYKNFFYTTGVLTIKNVNGVFNDIIGAGENVTFNLSFTETTDGYYLAPKDTLYVHKETLLMSSTKKDGYVKTKHIYLPRNDMKNQDKYSSNLVFTDFGIDRDTLIHSFEIRALKNIFGDCSNSEYCISREVA